MNKPFRNLDVALPEVYKKARAKARRDRNKEAKATAPGAPRVAVARNVLAWREANKHRFNV